jgi:prophage DNA circulation protein
LTGNTDIEDSLLRLDKLTQDEMQMASAVLLKVTHSVEGKVQDVRSHAQDVGDKVQGVDDRVQDIGSDVKDIFNEVRSVDDKLDQANCSYLFNACSSFR